LKNWEVVDALKLELKKIEGPPIYTSLRMKKGLRKQVDKIKQREDLSLQMLVNIALIAFVKTYNEGE